MSKKYKDKYIYHNHLSQCPNCGSPLSAQDKNCPACEINLVGYNEQANMAKNMENYADEIEDLEQQNKLITSKMQHENKKQEKRVNFKNKILKLAIFCVLAYFVAVIVYTGIVNLIDNNNAQTYEQVVEYLNETNVQFTPIDTLKYKDYTIEKTLSDNDGDNTIKVSIGYDTSSGTTILEEQYETPTKAYHIIRLLPSDVANLPEVDLIFGRIDYIGTYRFVDFDDSFITTEQKATPDDIILDKYTSSENNFITRLESLSIDNTDIYLYQIGQGITSPACRVVGVVQMDDNVFYISEIHISETEVGSDVVFDNLNNYFQIVQGE